MSFAPYLGFAGNARAAMTWYAGIFGATDLQIMDNAAAPADQRPPGGEDRVMHAQFSAGPGAPLMASDWPDELVAAGPGRSCVFHVAPSLAEARRIFDALAEGGEVSMPFAATFWSSGFGGCTDRFGVAWMITVAEGPPAA